MDDPADEIKQDQDVTNTITFPEPVGLETPSMKQAR
jgi:hypothetical protein